jgi:Ribonuclease G/E
MDRTPCEGCSGIGKIPHHIYYRIHTSYFVETYDDDCPLCNGTGVAMDIDTLDEEMLNTLEEEIRNARSHGEVVAEEKDATEGGERVNNLQRMAQLMSVAPTEH